MPCRREYGVVVLVGVRLVVVCAWSHVMGWGLCRRCEAADEAAAERRSNFSHIALPDFFRSPGVTLNEQCCGAIWSGSG